MKLWQSFRREVGAGSSQDEEILTLMMALFFLAMSEPCVEFALGLVKVFL